jgi:hypothetical protein
MIRSVFHMIPGSSVETMIITVKPWVPIPCKSLPLFFTLISTVNYQIRKVQ